MAQTCAHLLSARAIVRDLGTTLRPDRFSTAAQSEEHSMRVAKVVLAAAFVFGSIATASAQGGGGGGADGGARAETRQQPRAGKAPPAARAMRYRALPPTTPRCQAIQASRHTSTANDIIECGLRMFWPLASNELHGSTATYLPLSDRLMRVTMSSSHALHWPDN